MKKNTLIQLTGALFLLCFIFASDAVRAGTQRTVYLPVTFNNDVKCPGYYDDFSNPDSGWLISEDETAKWEYLDGEYRILSKDDYYEFYYATPPTCDRRNYSLEVDMRWVGEPGLSYGILFGIVGDLDQYYIFDVNTEYQDFGLWYFDGNDYVSILPFTVSEYINYGNAPNHLKVTKNNSQISLGINGFSVGIWTDNYISGKTYTAIISSPYDGSPASDARFDNFSITSSNSEPPIDIPEILIDGFNPSSYPNLDYVTLRSDAPSTVDLTGWWLKIENQSGRYYFPTGFTIGAGQAVNIRSGEGTDTLTDLYMGLPYSLWTVSNNCAYLRNDSGELADKLCVD